MVCWLRNKASVQKAVKREVDLIISVCVSFVCDE